MSLTIKYPDGETDIFGSDGYASNAEIIESADGSLLVDIDYSFEDANNCASVMRHATIKIPAEQNMDDHPRAEGGDYFLSGSVANGGGFYGQPFMQRWKKPGICNILFMFGEAWESGRLVMGHIDSIQSSGDLYRGFDSSGEPILDSKFQIGDYADPLGKLIALDVLRRLSVRYIPFCDKRRGPPPDKIEQPERVPSVSHDHALHDGDYAVYAAYLLLLAAGLLLLKNPAAAESYAQAMLVMMGMRELTEEERMKALLNSTT